MMATDTKTDSEGGAPALGGLDDILVAVAKRQGEVTSRQVAEATGVPIVKARQWLNWLVAEGRLKKVGRTKVTRFLPID